MAQPLKLGLGLPWRLSVRPIGESTFVISSSISLNNSRESSSLYNHPVDTTARYLCYFQRPNLLFTARSQLICGPSSESEKSWLGIIPSLTGYSEHYRYVWQQANPIISILCHERSVSRISAGRGQPSAFVPCRWLAALIQGSTLPRIPPWLLHVAKI